MKSTLPGSVEERATARVDRKRQAIIAAARRQFYLEGYGATTVDAIGRDAGIGKATIYKHFGSKEALFSAVVAQENRHGLDDVQTTLLGAGSLKQRLTRAGFILLDLLTAPEFIASYRMVMSEATRLPTIATLYYGGAEQLHAVLSECFQSLVASADLRQHSAERSAEHFVGLVRGDLQLRALLGMTPPTLKERADIVSSGVEVFLAAYGPAEPG